MVGNKTGLTVGIILGVFGWAVSGLAGTVDLVVLDKPLHAGNISLMLYSGFVELLDDVVPGMWAEMLGNRDFEGVLPAANWAYHLGTLNLCDRDWDKNETWGYSAEGPWNGAQSAKLTAARDRSGHLTQGGLAVTRGMTYLFSGCFRSGSAGLEVSIRLKSLLPDGQWMSLGSAPLPRPDRDWTRISAKLTCTGTTDRAVFEIETAGEGDLWMDKLSLMPADNIEGWRRDVVEATRELRPPVLRWGGSTIDPGEYKWKDQIGDRDRRPTFLTRPWGRRDSGDVGIEEFIRFCRAVGSEPLVCVSYADGARSAGELVEYCNGSVDTPWGKTRAQNGHPEPYAVKYWQLGNEVGNEEVTGRSADFCQAIRKADPKAVIFTSFPSGGLLERVGDSIRYLCPHYYTSDLAWVESDISGLRDRIRDSRYRDTVRLAVTEWNINAGNWGLGRGKLYTLDCALFEARFLNLLHRNSDIVEIACRSNLTNSFCGGTIQTNAAGLYKIPAYYVMRLFRDHTQPVPLKIAEVPGWLSVTACASQDHKRIAVFAVNTRTEPVEVRIDLSEFGPDMRIVGGEAVGDTQDRRQIDVTNGWDRPERVKTMPLQFRDDTVALPALSVVAVDIRE
ncbi:MAG: alpha-L-arabinofuranosidase C-terminal domain-containing protein [Phycisphaerales bacterium]